MSKEAISNIFYTDHFHILPKNNCVPSSFEAAKQAIQAFLIGLEKYDCCKNDCIIYRQQYYSVKCCPICNSPRYIDPHTPSKSFTYFPIGPRIARIYGSINLAKLLQYHCDSYGINSFISDITDTVTWNQMWHGTDGIFGMSRQGTALNFSSDGLNPWRAIGSNYSMWPMVLQI